MKHQKHLQRALFVLWLVSTLAPQVGWAQKKLTTTIVPGAPEADSPDNNNKFLVIRLWYTDPSDNKQVDTAEVEVTVAAWDKAKKETQGQAQKRKAQAIYDAIKNVDIPGVKPKFINKYPNDKPVMYLAKYEDPRTNKEFYLREPGWGVMIPNLTPNPDRPAKVDDPGLGVLYWFVYDPTKETLIGGAPNFQKFKEAPRLDGTRTGMSTGVDPFGQPSLISFGFYSDGDATFYLATLVGATNMTDDEILSELASQFNSICGDCGYTAFYSPTSDKLSFDRPLSPDLSFVTADTDTGIELNPEFGVDLDQP